MKKLRIIFWLLVVIYSAGAGGRVSAHADLLRSSPAAEAVLPRSPALVELFFSEGISPSLSSLKVFDPGNREVDLQDMRVDASDPTHMTVSLSTLKDGVYTVSWVATSTDDGHQTQGTFTFGIGRVDSRTLQAAPPTSSASLPISLLISKWLLLASLAVLAGKLPYRLLVWRPAMSGEAASLPEEVVHPPVWRWITDFTVGGTLLAAVAGLLAQAGQSTGHALALPWSPATIVLLASTRIGVIGLARIVLALLILWTTVGRPTPWKEGVEFGTALALLLSVSLTSHAAAELRPFVPVVDDWLHLVGMSLWFGGLAYLLTGLIGFGRVDPQIRTRLTSAAMRRFSGMALAAVGVIAVTGLYSASLRIGTLQALVNSIYGRTMLVKQAFVGMLLLLAAANLLYLSPRLRRSRVQGEANPRLSRLFRLSVTVETTLAVCLLGAVSLLTYLPPAHITPTAPELSAFARTTDLRLHLTITPGRIGQDTFVLSITSAGQPVTMVREALLILTPASPEGAAAEISLDSQTDGTYAAEGAYLNAPGRWQVQAIVRPLGQFDEFANFNFLLGQPGGLGQTVTPAFAGILFLLAGALLVMITLTLPVRKAGRYAASGAALALMLGLGFYFLAMPVKAVAAQTNPVAATQQSIQAGKIVYLQRCAACHGSSGRGDGPAGLALNPRPADLTLHGSTDVNTDAQLYDWITNGLPGTRMPAWKGVLEETDRWNLVNYIRYLAQAGS